MKVFALDHDGMQLVVEFDSAMFLYYRVRLIVDNAVADERALVGGSVMLRATHPAAVRVEATLGWWGPKRAVLHDDRRQQTIPFEKVSSRRR